MSVGTDNPGYYYRSYLCFFKNKFFYPVINKFFYCRFINDIAVETVFYGIFNDFFCFIQEVF